MTNRTTEKLEIGKRILARKEIPLPFTQIAREVLQAAIAYMSNSEQGELMNSIAQYSLFDKVVEVESNSVNTAMVSVRSSIDRDRAMYAYTVGHNSYAGYCSKMKRLYPNLTPKCFEDWLEDWLLGNLPDLEMGESM